MDLSKLNKQFMKVFGLLICPFVLNHPVHAKEIKPKPMGKNLYKRIETVVLKDTQVKLKAKMDTGAETSSLSAANIRVENEDGIEHVVFDVLHPNIRSSKNIKLPVFKWVKIKKRIEEGCDGKILPYTRRPVVKMDVALRGRVKAIMVSLADRQNMNYPLLIGRSAIVKYRGVVDPL